MKLRATFGIRLEVKYCTYKKNPHRRNNINVVCSLPMMIPVRQNPGLGITIGLPTRCMVCVCYWIGA